MIFTSFCGLDTKHQREYEKGQRIKDSLIAISKNFKLGDITLLFLIAIFSIGIRLPYLNCPLQPDEGAYAYQAYFWLEGVDFYKSRFFNMLPGLPLIYIFIFKIFGIKIVNIRLFLASWNAISVFFIYLITRRLLDKKEALASALIFSYLSWLPTFQGITQKECFMFLPYLISLYLYLLSQSERESYLFFSGVFLALAIIIRQTATFLLFHLLLFIYVQGKRKIRNIFIFLSGISFPLFLTLLYGCIRLGKMNLFYQVVGYRLTTASIFVGPWWWHLLRFLYSISVTGIIFLIFAALLGWSYLPKERQFSKWFIISFFLFSFLGGVIGGRWFFHYYLQIVPAFSIWLGWCGISILKQKGIVKTVFFKLLLMPFIFYIFAIYYTGDFYLSHERHYEITKQVSRYIKVYCGQNQEIYAFLYHNPGLYFLAQRKSAIPFLFRNKVLFSPKVLNHVLETIKQKKMDCLITYDLLYSLKIAEMNCGNNTHNFTKAIKACFSPDFSPFCKDYPIQLYLIKEIFKTIPKYYVPIKTIPFNDTKVIIWEKISENIFEEVL